MTKVNGSRNRRKGHDFERYLAKIFRNLGYDFCKTSRQASQILDVSGVDLAFIPYAVQAKRVIAPINYTEEFENMTSKLSQNFPPDSPVHNYPQMIFHTRGKKPTQRLVVVKEEDMISILQKLKDFEDFLSHQNNVRVS